MAINKVSFGNVVDIKYRYKKNDRDGRNKAESKAHMDFFSLPIVEKDNNEMLSINIKDVNSRISNWVVYDKMNRLITGDDYFTYKMLDAINPQYASKFADEKAHTLVVDV